MRVQLGVVLAAMHPIDGRLSTIVYKTIGLDDPDNLRSAQSVSPSVYNIARSVQRDPELKKRSQSRDLGIPGILTMTGLDITGFRIDPTYYGDGWDLFVCSEVHSA